MIFLRLNWILGVELLHWLDAWRQATCSCRVWFGETRRWMGQAAIWHERGIGPCGRPESLPPRSYASSSTQKKSYGIRYWWAAGRDDRWHIARASSEVMRRFGRFAYSTVPALGHWVSPCRDRRETLVLFIWGVPNVGGQPSFQLAEYASTVDRTGKVHVPHP